MAVALMNGFSAIELIGFGGFIQHTWVGSKTQGAADVLYAVLIRHQCDDRMGGGRIQLYAVCIIISDNISDKFYNGKLHTKTEPKEWDAIFPRIADSINHTFDATPTKSARN